ncbi:MAG TPA: efflux RND transporter periplasmic adaptor subunit, partial [Ferruginibacter sp.]|nr:efflux RND transporter periplasmic adaptor subunit [Ferruginibacter sp.]
LINKTVITAPFAGVIGLRQVSPGAYVTPTTVLATLQQTTQVKIDFTLPETYGNIVQKGSAVDVQIDAATQEKSKAKVVAIEPGADLETRNLKVRALLDKGVANPGSFVKVSIDIGHGRTAFKVPTNSIIPEDKNNQLVLVKNGVATFVNVETGIREENAVEIVKGINAGDSIIVRGVLFARPKSPVKVRSVRKLEDFIKVAEGS